MSGTQLLLAREIPEPHPARCRKRSSCFGPMISGRWAMPWHFGLTSMTTSTLPQLGLVELLETGFYPRYIRRLRQTLANHVAQYATAVEDMFPAGTPMTRPGGGNVLWIQLPSRLDGTTLYRRALEKGISVMPGEIF